MDAIHKDIVELIPWYVNGTLPPDEHAGVEKHVNECLPCRAALREAQRVCSLVGGHDDVPIGMEHGFSDLLRKIDGGPPRRSPPGLGPRLAYGMAAVCVAIAAWLLVSSVLAPEATDTAPFSTLTDGASFAETRIDIVFADEATEADIRGIIDSLGGRLVGGPSEIGRYTVAVEATNADDLTRLIERLSADSRVQFAGQNYIASPTTEGDEP